MTLSRAQFVERLTASGVLSSADVAEFEQRVAAASSAADAQAYAKLLVQHGKLTKYQASALYQGKTKGLVLGNYVLLDKLGAGGMGQVFKALHRRMERVVALKILPAEATKSADNVKRFQREVKAAARLEHPNIVAAHDADEADGVHFLVMQYVAGKDLSAIVKEHGPLPVAQAVECVRQAACGLAYAHKRGVIHRDIKPANLLLVQSAECGVRNADPHNSALSTPHSAFVKILDMGLARLEGQLHDAASVAGLTQSGQVMGTVDYMSPEQAEETRGVDARADQYSLGCTLWVLLTARPMFGGTTTIAKLMAHRTQPAPSLHAVRADVPAALEAVYQRMVAKEPDERFASMDEVIAALETCLGQPAPAALDGPSSTDSKLSEFFQQIGGAKTAAPPRSVTSIDSETRQYQPAKIETGTEIRTRGEGRGTREEGGEASVQPLAPSAALPASPAPRPAPRAQRKLHPLLLAAALAVTGLGSMGLLLGLAIWLVWPRTELDPAKSSEPAPVVAAERPAPSPLAVAPFDELAAKKHQQAWADYLGLPVEREIELPGGVKLAMTLIPPGEFLMGSTDEERAKFLALAKANDVLAVGHILSEGPQHRVQITQPFYLGKYEVTQAQWQAVMGSNPSGFKDDPLHPVEQVSWEDIFPLLAKLNDQHPPAGVKFALPTEAQWEYACRAGTTTTWYSGDSAEALREYGWFNANSGGKTYPVGQLRRNAWGLYDMHGNVWEWCADWHSNDYYAQSPLKDPSGSSEGSLRVARGGSWRYSAGRCGSAHRGNNGPGNRINDLGFRLAATIDVGKSLASKVVPHRPATPPLAVAPFDESTAKKHQQAWADYLGLPVEREIDLPDGVKLTMVLIPPGEFLMGSTDEERAKFLAEAKAANEQWAVDRIPGEGPQHCVQITQPFYLGKYEVTQAQWQEVIGSNPSGFKDNPSHPVEQVSWEDVWPFIAKLNDQYAPAGMKFVLPTEAQWEYACRAGTTTTWNPGESAEALHEYAWYSANAGGKTHPVGQLRRNGWGLYDMHGNVWEWCADWHSNDYYAQSPSINPTNSTMPSGANREHRGGSWYFSAGFCRSAHRSGNEPGNRNDYLGFRLAATIDAAQIAGRASANHATTVTENFALEFDGNSNHVEIPTLERNAAEPATIEAWVQPNDFKDASLIEIFGMAPFQLHHAYRRFAGLERTKSGTVRDEYRVVAAKDKFTPSTWYHVAYVVFPDEARIFVDGKLAGVEKGPFGKPYGSPTKRGASLGGQPRYYFKGSIAELRVSTIARYENDFAPPTRFDADADTLALYHFDEGTGDVLRDSSDNNHHGKIVGAKWVRVDAAEKADNANVEGSGAK